MNQKRWLQAVVSPTGRKHLHDIRAKTARTICGAATIGNARGITLWTNLKRYEKPTCQKCRSTARKRYGIT